MLHSVPRRIIGLRFLLASWVCLVSYVVLLVFLANCNKSSFNFAWKQCSLTPKVLHSLVKRSINLLCHSFVRASSKRLVNHSTLSINKHFSYVCIQICFCGMCFLICVCLYMKANILRIINFYTSSALPVSSN